MFLLEEVLVILPICRKVLILFFLDYEELGKEMSFCGPFKTKKLSINFYKSHSVVLKIKVDLVAVVDHLVRHGADEHDLNAELAEL